MNEELYSIIEEEEDITEVTPIDEEEEEIGVLSTETATTPEEPEIVFGRVVNCDRLNVREEPEPDADVVCTINALTDVEIVKEESTDVFYKVYLSSGLEGYCMRKYIVEVQP